ncbi:hypothetical protein H9Q70_010786 [Fusarium xylarioides]|nr:hypothetical protein H9Q70_010786 [Fusarium xylarioides]
MRPQATLCALWASLIPLCLGINISPTAQGGLALAQVLFGNSRDIYSSSSGYTGDPSAIRSFTNGPFGMGSGVIISTGSLTSAPLTPGGICPSTYPTDLYDAYTQSYCGPDSYNGANYLLNVLPIKATTFVIDMVIASCDVVSADKVLVLVNGVNVAKDETGTALDSSSKYLSEPWGIPSPNGDTAFAWTSPPLRFSITVPKSYIELKIAVCDLHDGYGDTAVMLKIRPCTDCDQSFKVDYDTTSVVSTTTYEATSVVTQAASGTVRGTISYVTYVTASATSTTQLHSLTECMEFCVDNLACRAVTFDTSFNECYLYDGFNGFMSDFSKDMAVVASRPVISSTTEAPTEPTTALATSSETSAPVESTTEFTESALRTRSSASMSSEFQETTSLPSSSELMAETTSADTLESQSFTASSATASEAATSLFTTLSSSLLTSETTSAGTLGLPSFTDTSATTSAAATSLPTALSPSTSLPSSQDAPSGTTSDSSLQFTMESESASAALATTSLAAISLSTGQSASASTDSPSSLSSESVSESTSDSQLVSTSSEESASLKPTTAATSIGSIHTDTTSIEMSTAETLTTKTPLEGTSTVETLISETSPITNSVTAIKSTATGSSLSDTSRVLTEIQSTSEGSALPSTSSAPSASNIPALGEYTFTGCLKSLEGYPSFKEVATDPEMTTRKCVDLAVGSEYIGVYQETCYKADVLDDTEFISDARCDLPCPGDRTLFCGGILRSGQRLLRRAIAPNHFLTLYRKTASSSSDVSSSSTSAAPSSSLQATGTHAIETNSESSGLSHYSQTDSPYSFSSFTTRNIGSETLSASDSAITETASETRLPTSLPTPTAIHTAYSTLTVNHAYTKTRFAETVTTVTYTTVNPSNPASLITTCVPITLLYSPCGYAGGSSHPAVKPTGGLQPGSKNDEPQSPGVATGLHDSHHRCKTHQPVNLTSAAKSNGDDQSVPGKPQPSIPAQGSPDSNNNSPEDRSQPASPTSLTTETSIVPTYQLGTSAPPSQSSPPRQSQVPSESEGAPHATSVIVSEAQRSDLATWIPMTAIVGMVIFL